MATVADLVVNLSANSTNLNVGLTKGRRDVKQFANDVNKDLGGAFKGLAPAVQSVTYAVDDFVAGFSTGGFAGGIRGAGNNISQLGMQIGGVYGLIAGVGVTLGFTLFDKIIKWSGDSETSLDSLQKKIESTRAALFKPFELPVIQPRMEDIQANVQDMSGAAARRRLDNLQPELSTRQANDVGLRENATVLTNQAQELAKTLSQSLGIDLSSAEATRKALMGGTVNTAPTISEKADKLLGTLSPASLDVNGAPLPDLMTRKLTDEQQNNLKELLSIQQESEKAIGAVTANLRQIETLQTEREALSTKQSPLLSGMGSLPTSSGSQSIMQAGSSPLVEGSRRPMRVFNRLFADTANIGSLGGDLATKMPGMAKEGQQLGDLNQSVRDKFNEKPGGRPSDGFAPSAEKGSLDAARIILGAMGQNRTQEMQKQQLDAQKAAVNELKKVGVTLKERARPMVVEELTA